MRIDSRKGTTMNLNLSDWDWLNAVLGVLFLYRGIRDLYNGTGTGWSSEDEKKHFHRFFGILSPRLFPVRVSSFPLDTE